MLNKKLAVFLLSTLMLSGCAFERIKQAENRAQATGDLASSLVKQAGDNQPVVSFHNSQYVNPDPLPVMKYNAPREVVNCVIPYKAKDSDPQDIWQFSQDISTICHVRTRVTPDAATFLGGDSGSTGSPTQQLSQVPTPVISNSGEMRPLASFGTSAGSSASAGVRATAVSRKFAGVTYNGQLGPLLDIVTARLGISWRFDDGMVSFYYLDTKRFDIEPSDAEYDLTGTVNSGVSNSAGAGSSNSIGSSSSSSSGGGVSGDSGTNLKSTVKMGNKLYKDLESTARSMLTPGVGRLDLNKTTGTVVVTDVPEVLKRIGDYLTTENTSLSKQVNLKVVIYSVNRDASDNLGFNWDVIYKTLANKYGINLAAPTSTIDGAGSLSFSVLDTATGAASQFAGTKFLLEALSKQGNVADVRTIPLMTSNMASTSVVVGRQITYLKEVSTTQFASGSNTIPQQTLTPGQVTTGTNITIFPKVLPGNQRMMLDMFLNISSLIGIGEVGTGLNKIQTPDVDSRSVPSRVWLKPGQTVVISGLEQNVDTTSKQGIGSPDNIYTGGNKSGSTTRQSFVITVTPFVG